MSEHRKWRRVPKSGHVEDVDSGTLRRKSEKVTGEGRVLIEGGDAGFELFMPTGPEADSLADAVLAAVQAWEEGRAK